MSASGPADREKTRPDDANPDLPPRFSASEYGRRYTLVREEMDRRGLAALILFGDSGHIGGFQTNCHYLSNYIDQFYSYVVFPAEGEPTLFFCLQPHETGVRQYSVIEDIRWGGWDIAAAVAGRIRELGVDRKRIGLVGVSSFQIRFTLPSDHMETLGKELPPRTSRSRRTSSKRSASSRAMRSSTPSGRGRPSPTRPCAPWKKTSGRGCESRSWRRLSWTG